ncbi:arylamine N-acetyltransferase [Streptomyces sp. A3M-1-3]|uniref:arylamine N-acetyltransferase family protein n=1 Tax=Streptomyces sp. A3M-1-3 TaxID=2962044 RepID=UPI0020B82A90|nr:arylamine N-acetyltransferase [Streptomyces sp. A3M-1-3]MCP3819045.1 arylamine N-acetyltransferase [Streptomyces sp. A3M-1-3]
MADTENTPQLDLDAYLDRTGWSGERRADAETLRSLHLAHMYGIPFENLDPLAGSAPSLALPDLEAKLIRGGRGGYCYEHNTLLTAVLEAFGFGVTRLAARVRLGADGAIRPRTHMLLLVDVPGEPGPYIADVGFGASGALLEAVPLVADTEFRDAGRRHRLVHETHNGPLELWVLQTYEDGAWTDQYAFTLEPFEAPDFEVINWHVATNPRSPFQHLLYVQRTLPHLHRALSGRHLVETYADGTRKERDLADAEEARQVLTADFGIAVPEGLQLSV